MYRRGGRFLDNVPKGGDVLEMYKFNAVHYLPPPLVYIFNLGGSFCEPGIAVVPSALPPVRDDKEVSNKLIVWANDALLASTSKPRAMKLNSFVIRW